MTVLTTDKHLVLHHHNRRSCQWLAPHAIAPPQRLNFLFHIFICCSTGKLVTSIAVLTTDNHLIFLFLFTSSSCSSSPQLSLIRIRIRVSGLIDRQAQKGFSMCTCTHILVPRLYIPHLCAFSSPSRPRVGTHRQARDDSSLWASWSG